jgi:hypothetical protein
MYHLNDLREDPDFKYLNRDFHFVYQPKDPKVKKLLGRRVLIGAWRLHNYIGIDNARKLIKATKKIREDKVSIKYRKYGIVDIYSK